ncbi:MAG: hypothetical protein N3B21_02610 [Clostridia bacterium]|nr:hypothetical protein [Clostridia bacterium]
MKQSNGDIKDIMDKALQQYTTSVQFESVWNAMPKNERKTFGFKKVVSIPLIAVMTFLALFTVGFAGYTVFRNIDKTDYPFIDDSTVIGKWESVDFVENIEDFNPEKKSWGSDLYLKSLVFTKGGQMLSAAGNGNLAYTSLTWTKDLLLSEQEKTASKYVIKDINGTTYMFTEWKSGDYTFRGLTPKLYVLKKVDSKDYSNYEAKRINEDKVDYPFIDDSRVIGKWESVDFVDKIENFSNRENSWKSDLFLTSLVFIKEGKMLESVNNTNLTYTDLSWTKEMVLNKSEKTASKYIIKDINGTKYMFFEWKTEDYIFRGLTPKFYVLKKVDNKDYSNYKVKIVREDKVDYPFVDDANMKGKWESVGFVRTIDRFKPGTKIWANNLYLKGLDFDENGKLIFRVESRSASMPYVTWTKGLIIDAVGKTASKCEIKDINGITYMFYEWKSGDYSYRGMTPWYYVLKKVE